MRKGEKGQEKNILLSHVTYESSQRMSITVGPQDIKIMID